MKLVQTLVILGLFSSALGLAEICKIQNEGVYPNLGIDTLGPVEISYEGVIASFKVENVTSVDMKENEYLSKSFEKDHLEIRTTPKFKDITDNIITVVLNFACTDKTNIEKTLHINVVHQQIPKPVFNMERYVYKFGMSLPKDFDLTQVMPIFTTDNTATIMYFHSTSSDYFSIPLSVENTRTNNDNSKIFLTSLKTTKQIEEPFEQEFVITAINPGKPEKASSVTVVVSISSDFVDTKNIPVFKKSLYYAWFNSDGDLQIEESISLVNGATNSTVLQLSGYTEDFDVRLTNIEDNGSGKVEVISKPPKFQTLENIGFINLDITAENKNITIKGQTTLSISLSNNRSICYEVFEKPLYFADYNHEDGLMLKEPIHIRFQNTKVELSNYKEYFQVSVGNTLVIKERFRPLPDNLVQKKEVVLELSGSTMGGSKARTAVFVRFKDINRNQDPIEHNSNIGYMTIIIIVSITGVVAAISGILILKWYNYKK